MLASKLTFLHLLCIHVCLSVPGPPYFGLSKQKRQTPHRTLLHLSQSPQRRLRCFLSVDGSAAKLAGTASKLAKLVLVSGLLVAGSSPPKLETDDEGTTGEGPSKGGMRSAGRVCNGKQCLSSKMGSPTNSGSLEKDALLLGVLIKERWVITLRGLARPAFIEA